MSVANLVNIVTKPRIALLFIPLLLSSCASSIETRVKEAEKVASINKFEKKLVKAGDFVITTYQRVSDKDSPYVFYIEGDGSISIGRYAIADNPTPSKVMLFKLATLDTRPNIVYIARPCQYTPVELNPNCNQAYWTDKRMAEEVIESTNIVINSINNGNPASLVGFSGGGGVAILVAARNKHIKDIITIAGNLDIENFSKHHGIYALKESLNPIDYAIKISNIPQLHLSGSKDAIVPSKIMQGYIKTSPLDCTQQKIFPNITHTKGWDKVWQEVLKINLTCGYNKKIGT
ncbi:alpha/beta hydrolase [Candidatus Tisiphia endosymbiont of Neophilaenus lineatus]|uniref:alpha/beta hydrolase n=1 Tax=Candidatus Tisiphia endosymbiont of Neophilaenus lineatus TaxID=3139336 RepID=UPI0035CA1882